MAAAPPGQQAGHPVGAVSQLLGGFEHPRPGLRARARLVPEHERHQPGGDPGPGGDIRQPRPPAHGPRGRGWYLVLICRPASPLELCHLASGLGHLASGLDVRHLASGLDVCHLASGLDVRHLASHVGIRRRASP